MTRIQRVIFNAGAWMPRPTPRRAIMPCSASRSRATRRRSSLTSATNWLQRAGRGLSTARRSSHPTRLHVEQSPNSSGEHVYGGLLISLDPNQPAPEYSSTNAKPDVSEVRLILTQPVTTDLDDLDLFIARRADVCGVLAMVSGPIDSQFVFMGNPFSAGFSSGFGPLFP